ncbi:HNH endonuclease [Zophobihabitans entericus]|uniref:HNH endonuclease n=1 Tax=Zophobihabitans entericus TaxID=1635327 RepID=A0A6G9IB25_9GAMM|nr:HNH endonuclease [Zophobihabitans entericus]
MKLPQKTDWQTDHIDPDSLGGANTVNNGKQLCRACNRELSNIPGGKNYKAINRIIGL